MNKTILMGRLTRDPEVRYTQTTNKLVATFTLAINRRGSKEADFLNIVAWGKTGDFVGKYFKKGMQVGVIGRLSTRDYEDKENKKRHVVEVVAEEVYFADSKKGDNVAEFIPDVNFFEEGDLDLPF